MKLSPYIFKSSHLSAIAITALTIATQAATIITPTSATSTTSIGGTRTIAAAIDSTGLSGGGTSGDILSENHDGGGLNTHWLSNTTSETVTFDLGGTFDLNTIYLWAYNRPERNRGVRTFDIAFSTNGGVSYSAAVTADSLGLADFIIGTSSGGDISSAQTRDITTQTGVTNIRLTNISNFGDSARIALPEIRFGNSVPEPTSSALLGLGGLGLLIRRRR
jgi:hypothetical protein